MFYTANEEPDCFENNEGKRDEYVTGFVGENVRLICTCTGG